MPYIEDRESCITDLYDSGFKSANALSKPPQGIIALIFVKNCTIDLKK